MAQVTCNKQLTALLVINLRELLGWGDACRSRP